jgi:hypothetical protein
VEEQAENADNETRPPINFHVYLPFTSCTIHSELPTNAKTCPTCQALPTTAKLGKV